MSAMNCPTCQVALAQAGRTFKCGTCDGAWVRAEVLVPMLEQTTATLVELPWQANTEDHDRACPECGTAMPTVKLGSVALDRCEAHGVWFDKKELVALIGQAKAFRSDGHVAREHHDGLLKRLAKLFGG